MAKIKNRLVLVLNLLKHKNQESLILIHRNASTSFMTYQGLNVKSRCRHFSNQHSFIHLEINIDTYFYQDTYSGQKPYHHWTSSWHYRSSPYVTHLHKTSTKSHF